MTQVALFFYILLIGLYIALVIWFFVTLNSIKSLQQETVITLRIIANKLSDNKYKNSKEEPKKVVIKEDYDIENNETPVDWSSVKICPGCGAKNAYNFDICIKCGCNL